ncbi:hypothetical protein PIB30_077218 [Stylosanthes scabra]|uniref:Uncharacterized protein n=1 Tax=Stylosanthes scabra TaxID=79078 RepID=A0ABU6SRQ9_9FABA|nr:hypothetical protein [Stylosanthes scabra]
MLLHFSSSHSQCHGATANPTIVVDILFSFSGSSSPSTVYRFAHLASPPCGSASSPTSTPHLYLFCLSLSVVIDDQSPSTTDLSHRVVPGHGSCRICTRVPASAFSLACHCPSLLPPDLWCWGIPAALQSSRAAVPPSMRSPSVSPFGGWTV